MLGKLVPHCELCFYHLSSVKDALGGFLFTASRSTAEQYCSKAIVTVNSGNFFWG